MEQRRRHEMEPFLITPRTKIHDLLEAFPDLEESLIKAAPPFKKLKNPVLRKTIARVTSLSQAATIGGIKVEDLINELRAEAGQQLMGDNSDEEPGYNYEKPDWFSSEHISSKIDISEMLDAGEQPVHVILAEIKKLKKEEILEIRAPFLPAPMIDKAKGLGYQYWINKVTDEEIYIYFRK